MKLSIRALVGMFAVVGLAVGFLGAFGWRYATRRLVVIDNPPTTAPGSKGFMFSFDALIVVAGPRWWPGLLVLPAVGLIAATAVALVCWFALKSTSAPWAIWVTLVATAVTTGACVAIATLLLTQEDRPAVLARIVEGASAARPNQTPLTDAQWDREWTPVGLWFPVVGILGALLITAVLYGVQRSIHRQTLR